MKRQFKRLYKRAGQVIRREWRMFRVWLKPARHKTALVITALVMAVTQLIPFLQPQVEAQRYDLKDVNHLLPRSSDLMAQKLTLDGKNQQYKFNDEYTPSTTGSMDGGGYKKNGGPKIKATAPLDASKGLKVTDPINNAEFTLTPKFDLLEAKQDSNRILYPLKDNTGWLIYTMQSDQVAEDLVLTRATSDTTQVKYDLGLGNALAARMLPDGSVGIYGSSLPINGQVSTGSEKDAKLLEKARKNAKKDQLLFQLPAPVIRQSKAGDTDVKAKFILKGSELTLDVKGLKTGKYPIDIDPSVYVQSAQGLMYGNNETNVNFDTTNNLFQKTTVSGGNIRDGVTQSSWTSTNALPVSLMGHATAISGGYIYVVGGSTTGSPSNNLNRVYWAKLNVSTSTAIGSWTTNTSYNLPVSLSRHALVAYNDFLYVIGGNDGSAVSSNIYSLHLAASGEPTPNWTALSTGTPGGSGLQLTSAVAYENRMYVLGGRTSTIANSVVSNTYMAEINADGTLGSWSAQASLPLTAGLEGASATVYNDYVYVVGGDQYVTGFNTYNLSSKIYYAPITASGLGAWRTNATEFSNARTSQGGNFMTIWAGYMYINGGCASLATTATGAYCTAGGVAGTQIASINADGSIGTWTTLKYYNTTSGAFENVQNARYGFGLVSFGTANDPNAANAGGTLYAIGGCTTGAQSATFTCTTSNTTVDANISSEGDIGPSQTTTALPNAAGGFSAAIVVNNGFIYNIGGCTSNACGSGGVSTAIYYAPVNADGTLGAWSTATRALTVARAALSATVIGNVLYMAGGTAGTNGATSGTATTGYSVPIERNGNITATITATNNVMTNTNDSYLYPYVFSAINQSSPTTGYVYAAGGCTGATGVGCSDYTNVVRRCTITIGSAGYSGCTTITNNNLPAETGIAAGAQYGNYVYLSSGANSNNAATAGATPGTYGGQTNITYYTKIDGSGLLSTPPGRSGAFWQTTTGRLADNGVTYSSSITDHADGQRRRSSAFAVNGYLYVLGGHDGNTGTTQGKTLQDMEIGKINPSTGDIASFVDNYYQITPRWDFKGIATNGYIYAVGGCSTGYPPGNCTAMDRAVQYMQTYNNASGSPASYGQTTAKPTARTNAASAVLNGRIYLVGGSTTISGNPDNLIQVASIDDNGDLSSWSSYTGLMSNPRFAFGMVASGDSLYMIGGRKDTTASGILTEVDRVAINPNTGTPGTFTAATPLPSALSSLDAVSYNGYVYVSGGATTGGTISSSVLYATLSSTAIGSWGTTSSFSVARRSHNSIAYNGALYIIGGSDGTSGSLSDVQYAKINTNGTLGTFNTTTPLPQPVATGSAFAANGYMYVVGGRSNGSTTGCTNNTYVAPFSANSTVTAGNNPNGLGNWFQTAVSFGVPRFGAASTYANGRAYILAGESCASTDVVTGADRSYYATLQSQPQVASYSYAIDANFDVFPSKSLFNGIDNGIGANWVLEYRSSTDASKIWGENFRFGKTTLGTPQDYIPRNGAGTNTNFARYYWIKLSIDGSQAFGYPEDVSRGPTIANLTLQFTANPSQRLRNGKTFINNVEQPLDAPF